MNDREARIAAVREWLVLPRGEQADALAEIRATYPDPANEAWNTRFGPGSLFEAWTGTALVRGLYDANARLLQRLLKPGFSAVEIGGGDGRLWERTLPADAVGELTVVDPAPEVHECVASVLPDGVMLRSIVARAEEVELPPADVVVCSLTLHHVAGAEAKIGVLRAISRSIRHEGAAILNEADVYCDVGLPPRDPILVDRLLDSYVRRCGVAMLDELKTSDDPRLLAILWTWCLGQVDVAFVPLDRRDVYELDVPRWLDVIAAAGLVVVQRGFTDRYGLFHRYVLRTRGTSG